MQGGKIFEACSLSVLLRSSANFRACSLVVPVKDEKKTSGWIAEPTSFLRPPGPITFLGAMRGFLMALLVIRGSIMAVCKDPISSLPPYSEGVHGRSTSFDGFAFSITGVTAIEKGTFKRLIRDL